MIPARGEPVGHRPGRSHDGARPSARGAAPTRAPPAPRRRGARDRRERGLRHRRPPPPRPALGRPLPDHPGPRERRPRSRIERAAPRRRGTADRAGNARHVLRRLRHLRCLLALPRRARRDALSSPEGLRHHGGRLGRPARRVVGADRNPSGRPAGAAARRNRRRRLPGRRLRPADRLSRRRARRDRHGRHRRRPGLGTRWPERRDLRAALGGARGLRRRGAGGPARGGAAPRGGWHARHHPGSGPFRPHRLGARPHARPGRRRRHRSIG